MLRSCVYRNGLLSCVALGFRHRDSVTVGRFRSVVLTVLLTALEHTMPLLVPPLWPIFDSIRLGGDFITTLVRVVRM